MVSEPEWNLPMPVALGFKLYFFLFRPGSGTLRNVYSCIYGSTIRDIYDDHSGIYGKSLSRIIHT